ncbi:MAG: hypothetical protein IPP77_12775 [Bacteroidetes bacterium]|nr:hypothetical protein [Bacteroidota bacterium]
MAKAKKHKADLHNAGAWCNKPPFIGGVLDVKLVTDLILCLLGYYFKVATPFLHPVYA